MKDPEELFRGYRQQIRQVQEQAQRAVESLNAKMFAIMELQEWDTDKCNDVLGETYFVDQGRDDGENTGIGRERVAGGDAVEHSD